MEAEGCIIPDVINVKNPKKGRRRGVWGSKNINNGGNRVQMLVEDDYRANLKKKMYKDAYSAKEMQLNLSQQILIVMMRRYILTKTVILVIAFVVCRC